MEYGVDMYPFTRFSAKCAWTAVKADGTKEWVINSGKRDLTQNACHAGRLPGRCEAHDKISLQQKYRSKERGRTNGIIAPVTEEYGAGRIRFPEILPEG